MATGMEMLAKTLQSMIPKQIWELVETNIKKVVSDVDTMKTKVLSIEAKLDRIEKLLAEKDTTNGASYAQSDNGQRFIGGASEERGHTGE